MMHRVHLEQCPICGASSFEEAFSCVDNFVSKETYQVVKCPTCGFLCTQDVPDAAHIGSYYQSDEYISHSDTKKGVMNSLYHYARQFMLTQKAQLVERTQKPDSDKRLLEVGSGTGYFAHTMDIRGWRVTGVEPSDSGRQQAKELFQLDLRPTDILDNRSSTEYPKANSFDAIALWHVLEHIPNLNERMEQFHEWLQPDGRLVLAVPNHASFDAQHYGADWAAYDTPRHLWHFDAQTMEQLAKKHGFVMESMHPMPLDAFYVSMLTEQHKGNTLSAIRGLFTGCVAALSLLFGKTTESSSLIYVLKKVSSVS